MRLTTRVIHVSEADAAKDFAGLLARVRSGAEVIIENGKTPVAVVHAPDHLAGPFQIALHCCQRTPRR